MPQPIGSLWCRPSRLNLGRLLKQERLPRLAQLEAERHLAQLVRGVDETLLPGGTADGAADGAAGGAGSGVGGGAGSGAGGGAAGGAAGVFFEADDGRRVSPGAEARPPRYTRVEHVRRCHELDDARFVVPSRG